MTLQQYFAQIWTFFIVSLKATFRSFAAVFFGLLFPLVFVAAFGLASGGSSKLDIGIIDSSGPSYTFWKESLSKSDSIKLYTGDSQKLFEKFKENSYDALIEVTPDTPLAINLYVSTKRPTTSAIAEQLINTYIDKATIAKNNIQPIYTVTRKSVETSNPRYIDFILPGLIGFSLISGAIQGLSSSFLTLKKTQALKRLFAAPASISAYLIGKSAASLMFSLLQVTILLIASMTFFGYAPLGGAGTIAQMYAVIILGIALFQGFGFVIAGLANTTEQASAYSQLATLPQFILGGTFFAVTTLPDWLQPIIKLLPLYSFNEAMRYLSLEGLNLFSSKVHMALWPLGIWLIVVYFIAFRVFKIK